MSVDESVIPTVEERRVINPNVRFQVRATNVGGTPGLTIHIENAPSILNDPLPLMMPVGDTLEDLHVINPMIRFQVWVIDVAASMNSLIDCGFFNRIIPIHFSTQSLPDEDDIVRAACAWARAASYDGESAQEGKLFEYVSIVDSVGVLLRDLDPTTMHSVPMLGGVKYVGDTTVCRSDPGSSLHCVVDSLLGRIVGTVRWTSIIMSDRILCRDL